MLKWIFSKWGEGIKWIDLAQERNAWWARGNEASGSMNAGNFLASSVPVSL
jgi:hypothetical protein